MWQHIKDLVPLGQTALWVGLIVWIVNKYGSFIDQLLELIRKRVESGSSIKAGSFEIGQALETQSVSDQRIEADEEIRNTSESPVTYETLSVEDKSTFRSEYFLIEDLALRAIQDEYGEPIQRNVKVLSLFQADGVFTKDGTLHLVEVKATTQNKIRSIAKISLLKLDNLIKGLGYKNIVIVLVVVVKDSDSILSTHIPVDDYKTKVNVHTYLLKELKATFGID